MKESTQSRIAKTIIKSVIKILKSLEQSTPLYYDSDVRQAVKILEGRI